MSRPRTAALLAAAALAAAAPAAHATPSWSAPLKPCYVSVYTGELQPQREEVNVGATGFRPGALVSVKVDGVVEASGVAVDATGAVAAAVPSPFLDAGQRRFVIEVFQEDDPAQLLAGTSRVAALTARLRPATARPSQRIRFSGRGFTRPAPVYAHYVKGDELRRTVRLARPRGPCGRFRARRRQFPFRPSTGRWKLQIDQRRRYSPETAPARYFDILVRTTIRG